MQILPTPRNLFSRLTPVENKSFKEPFQDVVRRLRRPYYLLSDKDYEAVKMLSGDSDVLLLDSHSQVTFGTADGGYALMPLSRPI